MSVSGLFNIGITAMQTTNQLLDITSHNIANANTPGYTRQDAIVQSIPSGFITTTGATGNGVQVSDIQRMYNAFVNNQLSAENSNLSYWNNYQTGITQVEDVFNEASTTGISPAISSFYNDWQNVAQNPQDDAQRTTLIQDASYLSSRLNTASASLNNERSQLLTDSQSLANQVNADTSQIADLNAKIAGNPGALDLLDQRDALVQSLNAIVKSSSYTNNSGMVTVMLGGTPLVEGATAFNLSANADASNMMQFYVAIVPSAAQGSDGNPAVTSLITGGQLKANLDLRDNAVTGIPAYLNKLNAFAIDLADTTNYYQKQGYGLDGSPGGNLFQPLSLQAKYTSVDSVNGVFTSQTSTFSTNGGTLKIKLGDNDATPATVNVAAGATLNDIVNDINIQAGSKVTATVVDVGTSASHDYRISIRSDGNLGDVRISASNAAGNGPCLDGNGSGLNLLATNAVMSSTSVTNPDAVDPKAQYKIDYNYNGGAGYQEDSTTGIYWRVQKSDDGSTWTTVNPNLTYDPSNPSTINETEVNLTPDTTGSLSRTLEFDGIKVKIDGAGINSTTNPNGETFDVQLDPNAASDVKTVITDPKQVAASTDMFTVDSTNNTVVFNVVTAGGVSSGPITAVIPAGSYTNDPGQSDDISSALTTAIQTAYQNAMGSPLPDTLNAVFNPNTKQFNITMVTGSDTINFNWSNAGATAKQIFGFSNDASLNSFVINGTNNKIAFLSGGITYTATIPIGTYTGANLASAIQTQLLPANLVPPGSPNTLNVSYNAARQFTVTNTAGPAVTIFEPTANATIPQQLGFAPGTTNISAGGTATSAAIGNSAVSDNPASVFLSANKGIPGDNRNATTIGNLANGNAFVGTSPVDFYNSLVSDVGVNSASAKNSQQYESNMVDQLTQRRSEVSGVSMDQEAANLVIYQKSYQAAAQMITLANTLLTTLMQMVSSGTAG